MELPNIQELLERTIYHSLRLTTVAAGYVPDILQYDVENPDIAISVAESNRYKADLAAIKTEKGFAIELFNSGPAQQRGSLKVPRIVLQTEAFLPGGLGLDTTEQFDERPDGNFGVYANPFLTQTSDMYFNIKLVGNSVKQERVLNGILLSTLPRRGYIKWADQPTLLPSQNIFVHWAGHGEDMIEEEGIIEKSHRFFIADVKELDPVLLREVPAITQIGNLDVEIE